MIVESGSITPGADSLCSLETAAAYHEARGRDDWFAAPDQHESLLVRATDHVCLTYGGRWAGLRESSLQPLCWPRTGVVTTDGYAVPVGTVPLPVQHAVAETAYQMLTGELAKASTPARTIKSEAVGSIRIEYADTDTINPTVTTLNTIGALLAPYLGSSSFVRLQRIY